MEWKMQSHLTVIQKAFIKTWFGNKDKYTYFERILAKMLILNAAWLGIQLSQKVSFEYSHGNLNMYCLVTHIVQLQNAIFYF